MMKISRLYLKILFAFILVLLVAILGVGGLLEMGHIRPPFTFHAENRTKALKQIVGMEIGNTPRITPQIRQHLNSMLDIFADAFNGEAWIVDKYGTTIAKSFEYPIPLTGKENLELKLTSPQGDRVYLIERGNQRSIYSTGVVETASNRLTLHLLNQWRTHNEEVWFMEGLILTATIAALLLIPVSRRITRPINELTQSAEQLSRGDFSPRVDESHKDEVGTLAKAFNRMARSLEKMVRGGRELTANLSHELRSPLARIRVSQQIIHERLESGRTDGVKQHVLRMEEEINHMDSLIDKIMKLSKLDLQEPPPREDIVSLPEMLTEAVERIKPLIGKSGISMRQDTRDVPRYRCRNQDIRIVLDNVLTNAIKYSPNNEAVSIGCEADDDAITIRVVNAYPLLSEAELETVFIPFKRLGYDDIEGNGLGLAFAKKIVEDHGGTIQASSIDTGFCMTIRLPLD